MLEPIVVHEAQHGRAPRRLVLLFHGVGAQAQSMVPLGRLLASASAGDVILSMPAAHPSDLGAGRQWFSVRGVTEENRPGRVQEALPLFEQAVKALQARYGVAPAETVLLGFSQGAIMSLESARAGLALAGRIVSIAGRFAQRPESAPQGTTVHLVHGDSDEVIDVEYATSAAQRLQQLGVPVTLDVLTATGHEITQEAAQRVRDRLA